MPLSYEAISIEYQNLQLHSPQLGGSLPANTHRLTDSGFLRFRIIKYIADE